MAVETRQELPFGAMRIGRLTRKYDLALPFQQVLCHAAIFGPPGSGKSSSFFMSMARDWSRRGSAIFLDPKGEMYTHTARYFKRVYRLDLADPWLSDRWNFVPACRGDAELAAEIASIIVGYDANKNASYDPFWPQAETALLTSLLLHLPHIAENPTPAHLTEFIGTRGVDQINYEMQCSPDAEALVKWGIFKKADVEKTQGGVYIGLGVKLKPFRSPHAMAVMQSDGRSLSAGNYFYLYHQVDARSATIWIIPTGPRRDEGSTRFLLLRPDSLRQWKGLPLSLDEIKNLPAVPQYRQMALLGMTEQKPIELSVRK